jgi:membrane protein implicated in regulation of membrane protease activity
MELLSGIVLTIVILGIAVYLAKEVLGEKTTAMIAEYKRKPLRTPNHHLVGSTGTVISEPQKEGEHMRVRIGIERWNARAAAGDAGAVPVGTTVRVTAVEGLVLQVEPDASAAEAETRPSAEAAAVKTTPPAEAAEADMKPSAGTAAAAEAQSPRVQPPEPQPKAP